MTAGKRWGAFGALLAVLALAVAAVGTGVGGSQTNAQAPIVIGWAYDSKGNMAPFDNPALAAARIRVDQVNAKGGVNGRPLQDRHLRHEQQQRRQGEVVRGEPARQGCERHLHDLRRRLRDAGRAGVDRRRGKLTLVHMHRHRPDGAEAVRQRPASLAFSFGNVAQDEGSAMAEYAWRKGWRTANLATNTYLVYFKNVVQAFEKRFTQLGGKIAARESYATGANNVTAAVSRLNARKADVIVTSTAFGELPALVYGLRSLGNKTAILNSWAGDGTYWNTPEPAR